MSPISETSPPSISQALLDELSKIQELPLKEQLATGITQLKPPSENDFPSFIDLYKLNPEAYWQSLAGQSKPQVYISGEKGDFENETVTISLVAATLAHNGDGEKWPVLDVLLIKPLSVVLGGLGALLRSLTPLFPKVNKTALKMEKYSIMLAKGEGQYGNLNYSVRPVKAYADCINLSPALSVNGNPRAGSYRDLLQKLDTLKRDQGFSALFRTDGKAGTVGRNGGTELYGYLPGPFATHPQLTQQEDHEVLTDGKQGEWVDSRWQGVIYDPPLPVVTSSLSTSAGYCIELYEGDTPKDQKLLRYFLGTKALAEGGLLSIGADPDEVNNVLETTSDHATLRARSPLTLTFNVTP